MDDPVERSEQESIAPDIGDIGNKVGQAANTLKSAENSAAGKPSGKNAKEGEKPPAAAGKAGGGPGSLFTGKGKNSKDGKDGKNSKKGGMLAKLGLGGGAPLLLILVLLLVLIPALLIIGPMFMIGDIDYNLQDSLGFSDTTAIIEEQGENIVAEELSKGHMPSRFSGDLADAGILVGQVTASGDFVRTNTYLAHIDDSVEIAATGYDYHTSATDGELAILFENQVIKAGDFVAAVESNPRLYAAYSSALDVSARFYYSDDVDRVYNDLGLSRGAFNGWQATGNYEADEESFAEILQEVLNNEGSSDMSNCSDGGESEDDPSCDSGTTLSSGSDASSVVSDIVSTTKGNDSMNATQKAAQLLNTAISSNEPRQAASAFLAVEEPIQRARIDGTGPVNQLMNTLSRKSTTTYVDVNTNEEVTQTKSVLETVNFVAAVSQGTYSHSEANNFSRDRVLIATETTENDEIKNTTIGSERGGKSSIIMQLLGSNTADATVIDRATSSVAMSAAGLNDGAFSSVVGGNRIVEGGSYLSNTINAKTLGAMPSDAETIAEYQREVDTVLARKAAADRATLSPFDISSPHTFMGSIVHGLATSLLSRSSIAGGSSFVSTVSTVADLTGGSVNSLLGGAIAEGNGQKFTTVAGNCSTVREVGAEGDLYCNSHNTISTKYMKRTKEEWASALSDNLDESGGIVEDSGLGRFVKLGMERDATVGVKSATVCEAEREEDIITNILIFFDVYNACTSVEEDIATGRAYALTSSNSDKANVEQYSGYALYDMVSSLIKDSRSSVSLFKEEYYKAHPKDNSAAGRIARFSGMTKADAELALGYAEYLTTIANYNPATRHQFGQPIFTRSAEISFVGDAQTKENLYCFWCGRFERSEERNRSFAA